MKFSHVIAGAAIIVAPTSGLAATTLVDLGFGTAQSGGFGGYVVQSFTATIDNMAGLEILVGGSSINQTGNISAGLYSDASLTTELAFGVDAVDTSEAPLDDLGETFASVLWSPVALTLGQTYYLSLDTTNQNIGFYIFGNGLIDSYAGGQLLAAADNDPYPNDYTDLVSLKFFTDPEFGKDPGPGDDPVTPVPLPAGAPLLLAGLGLLACRKVLEG